jgi:hypothetical protein
MEPASLITIQISQNLKARPQKLSFASPPPSSTSYARAQSFAPAASLLVQRERAATNGPRPVQRENGQQQQCQAASLAAN